MNWYKKNAQDVVHELQTDERLGLTLEEVELRKSHYGFHVPYSVKPFSFSKTFLNLLREPLILLLAVASTIIFFAGDSFDAFIIVGVILLNGLIGAVQECRISRMVSRLRTFKKQQSVVVRFGTKVMVDDEDLVPGDILLLQEGEHVPADARIIESYGVTVDESVLTGESDSVRKTSEALIRDCQLSEQSNMLFCGSHMITGSARAVVVVTGVHTTGRKSAENMEVFSQEMPLQRDLSRVLNFVLWLIVFICVSLFIIGVLAGKPFPELLAALLALFMCVVPQGLPVIMTIILVSGAYVLARHKIVAKRLQAIEALGRAQVALIDKTGTLTKNELMVVALNVKGKQYSVTGSGYHTEGSLLYEGEPVAYESSGADFLHDMMEASILLDGSVLEWHDHKQKWAVKGSPNEVALRICARKYGVSLEQVELQYTKLYEIPFGAAHQYHAGFYEKNGKGVLFGIGSFEAISRRCSELTTEQCTGAQKMLKDGLRVLAFASKEFSLTDLAVGSYKETFFTGLFDEGLTFLGTAGISDTLRSNIIDVVHKMQRAGVQVVMATGDSVKTASYMGRLAGILKNSSEIMEGTTLQQLSDYDLATYLPTTTVYARLLPSDKARLVNSYQQQGKVVMVIGDGVNDVPALASANVSIAMGSTGSEIAKETAHILLLDDACEKIPYGIAYGRHIFYTFKRVILYFFATNFAEVLVMLFSLAGGYPVPLLACQILWLNLVTDGFLDTALSLEPLEKNLMHKAWFDGQATLMTKSLAIQVFYSGFLAAGLSCTVFLCYLQIDLALARTMAMVTLTCCQWVTALNCRSLERSIFSLSLFSNRWLTIALGGILVTQVALIYVPFLQAIFKTVPLEGGDWLVVILAGFTLLVVEEVKKYVKRCSVRAY